MNKHSPLSEPFSPVGSPGAVSPPQKCVMAPDPIVCPECEGAGFFVSGAFHPDDPRTEASWDCENCGGTGEAESDTNCQCGEPLDANGYCASCEALTEIEHLGPGRIAA